MTPGHSLPTRRDFLWHSGGGLGGIALAAFLNTNHFLADAPKRADSGLHHKSTN